MIASRQPFATLLLGMFVAVGLFAPAPSVHAGAIQDQYDAIRSEGLIFANLCKSPFETDNDASTCACKDYGKCSLEQVLQMFVNISYLILALSGSAALVVFIYGGAEWVLSAGYTERVDRGKKAIVGAVIGLVIVFGAYTFINLLLSILITGEPATAPIEDTIGTDIIDTQ